MIELTQARGTIDALKEEIKNECSKFSQDIKFWAEFQTGIKVKRIHIFHSLIQSTDSANPSYRNSSRGLLRPRRGRGRGLPSQKPSPRHAPFSENRR